MPGVVFVTLEDETGSINVIVWRDVGDAQRRERGVQYIDGAAGVAQVTDAFVRDAVVSGLRRKVVYTVIESMPWEAANVRVLLKGGKQLQSSVQHCRGSAGRPLSDADITEKTQGQLRIAYPDAAAERILAQSWRIEECPRVDAFCKELAAGA